MFEKIFPKEQYGDHKPSKVVVRQKSDCLICECGEYGLIRAVDRKVGAIPFDTREQRQADRDKLVNDIIDWSTKPATTKPGTTKPAAKAVDNPPIATP